MAKDSVNSKKKPTGARLIIPLSPTATGVTNYRYPCGTQMKKPEAMVQDAGEGEEKWDKTVRI